MQVTDGADRQVEQTVTRQGRQHVVQKANPGRDVGLPRPVQVQGDRDIGFRRGACDRGGALHEGTTTPVGG